MSSIDHLQQELETLFPPSEEELALKAALSTRNRLRALIENSYTQGWMSAEEQIRWKDAIRPRSIVGTTFIIGGSGEQGSFTCFHFNGQEYLKNEKGVFGYDPERNLVLCDDTKVAASIESLENDDARVLTARDLLAKDYAEGDPILGEILRIHLEYNDGKIEPTTYEGILFFQVGRNASHDFFAGTRNGKRYVLAIGEGCAEYDENGETIRESEIEYSLREVQEGRDWGYLGHF